MIIHSPIFSGSINQAESAFANLSGSFTGSFTGVGNFEGLEADSVAYENVTGKPTLVSGSSQVSFTTISDKPTLVSGSSQVDVEQTTNFSTFSSSIASTFSGLSSDFADLQNKPTLVSGSGQIVLENADKTGFTGASSITTLGTVTAGSVTAILPSGTVSGSSQVDLGSVSNNTTTNVSEGTNLYYTDTRVKDKLNAETVISGSSQVSLSTTDVSEGTNLYYTDTRVKTKLNTETVVSGSTQILTLVSIDEDNMVSNSDTKLPTQQSVKSYVDAQVSGLVDSAPGTLDTLNELAAALGDDANFATTVSTTISGKVSQSLEIISGNGLTGGGNLTTNRTLAVGGTTDRISVSADAVDIASTYVGQSSITTLGTIGTGTWQGSVIASAYLDADTAHLTTTQTFSGAKTFSAAVSITDSTASTTKTTGALKVTGGVGIEGALNVGGDVVAYASSDKRLKDNIKNIENPIQKVQKLNGVTWDWNSNADELQQSLPNVGVIAQEVEEVLPQLVHNRDNGFKGVDYAKLTGLLIEAIKEQQKQIDELKSKLQ
jgi:hypothetical protein